jgi:hypothetical protein
MTMDGAVARFVEISYPVGSIRANVVATRDCVEIVRSWSSQGAIVAE